MGDPGGVVPSGPVVVLVPSPLVGPAVWRPVAQHLGMRGWEVVQVDHPASAPSGPDDVHDHLCAALSPERDVVLVSHSNAGAYVPRLVVAHGRVVAAVFVDAILPQSEGTVPLAPSGMQDHLAALAVDARLPPWTDWFDPADVDPLFPDAATRRTVESQQHRLPLAYFDQSVPVPAGWDHVAGGYLAFGDTYADEREAARSRGWPVTTMDGGHLHMLVDPAAVAAAIDELLAHHALLPNDRA